MLQPLPKVLFIPVIVKTPIFTRFNPLPPSTVILRAVRRDICHSRLVYLVYLVCLVVSFISSVSSISSMRRADSLRSSA